MNDGFLSEFIITETLANVYHPQLVELYAQMWWADKRTLDEINEVINNSSFIVAIIDSKQDRLVAFTRILTDYATLAYLFDVIVCESYRGKALGKHLMNYITEHEKLNKVIKIELSCREDMIPFYRQFGFLEKLESTIVMRRVNSAFKRCL